MVFIDKWTFISSQGKRLIDDESTLGGRRSRGAARQVTAPACVAARREPRPPVFILTQMEQSNSPASRRVPL